jgi:hypothetical protein
VQAAPAVALDDLNKVQRQPKHQPGTPRLSRMQRRTKEVVFLPARRFPHAMARLGQPSEQLTTLLRSPALGL